MYFAPGTSGSITTWLLTVLHEITASSKTITPVASARIRPRLPRGKRCLMSVNFVMRILVAGHFTHIGMRRCRRDYF
jgi:hypothetical protein